MIGHALRRAAWATGVLWAVVTLTFLINALIPSDPARMVAGPQARPGDVVRIREQLGLDRPVLVQYGRFMGRLAHASLAARGHETCGRLGPLHIDLGRSYQQRRPVVTIVAERLPKSMLLAAGAVLVQVVLGVGAGVAAAVRRHRVFDHAAVGASLIGISAPTFLLGIGLQYLLAHKLRLLPLDGYGQTTAEHLACLVLPALTLGLFGAAYYTRLTRDEMSELLRQDFVRTARAKGASEPAVVLRHALRNALLPLLTMMGLDLGALVGGAIVTERLFGWPGIGAMSVTAVFDRDGPVVMGAVIVSSTAIVMSNLAVDLLYATLDPRTRR